MRPLPKPSIDTGAGLERLAAAVAGFESNYDTDLLAPLVEEAKRLAGRLGRRADDGEEAPFRVIADHARATAFLIADGVFPDNAGRSYVLRRIMRRAIRHGTEVGLDRPFFHIVCHKVVEMFGDVYPELPERAATIQQVVQGEEEAFRRTLDRGLKRLSQAIEHGPEAGGVFDPRIAAELYDTYGFPIDLTGVIVSEQGLRLDEAAAEAELRQRQSGGGRGSKLGQDTAVADVYFAVHAEVGDSVFLGYETTEATGTVRAVLVDGTSVDKARVGTDVEVVLDQTPMYAEGGGQIGDIGSLVGEGVEVEVSDTRKPVASLFVHRGRVVRGELSIGEAVQAKVEDERRDAIRRNHSATHLLHLALRRELGGHVVQKGSLVTADRLRFDFSHNRPLTGSQKKAIESRVNRMVLANRPTRTEAMSPEQARQIGAIGLFDTKYGETVRVVCIGEASIELCGGTHVARAGDIGLFAIVAESSIAQGVRRIEAVTGMGALQHVQALVDVTQAAMGQLHTGVLEDIPERIDRLHGELRNRDRKIEQLSRKLATGGGGSEGDDVCEVEGIKLLTRRVAIADPKALRAAADTLRDRLGSGVVVLGADTGGKAMLLVAVTQDLQARVHAGRLVGALAPHVDGRGGGRADLAQAGGPKPAGLDAALGAAEATLREMLAAS
jgi:alanyl-tRNA synthetase